VATGGCVQLYRAGAGIDLEPTIDVIIPAYNAQDFIVQAIVSVKSQSYAAARTIVVDDGSTDRTAQLIREHFAGDSSIVYIHKENGGLSSARNRGIREANADLVAFLDADDLWLPTKLHEQVQLFLKTRNPQLGLVFCGYGVVDEKGRSLPDASRFLIDKWIHGDVFEELLSANYVLGSGSAVLIKRQCFEVCGTFDESLPSCEDWDMWLRLAQHYHFDYVQQPLIQIRRHGTNMQRNPYRMFDGYVGVFNKWVREASRRPEVLRFWRLEYSPPIIAAMVKELPATTLYRRLAASMSPEVKQLASTHVLQTMFALVRAAVRKGLNR